MGTMTELQFYHRAYVTMCIAGAAVGIFIGLLR